MDEKSMIIGLFILVVVAIFIMIVAGKLKKREDAKMDFTDEDLDSMLLIMQFYGYKEVRKKFHIRRNYALRVIILVGFCLLFFSQALMVAIILYALSLSQPAQLVILPIVCLIVILLNLAFLSVVIPKKFNQNFRIWLKRNLPKKEKNIFLREEMTKKLKKPVIYYEGDGKYY